MIEPTYRYIRARLCHETALAEPDVGRSALLGRAAQDWEWLRDLVDDNRITLTAWECAQIFILSAATEAALEEDSSTSPDDLLARGGNFIDAVVLDEFKPDALHQDIKAWRKVAAAIASEGADAELPDIDFVTVE